MGVKIKKSKKDQRGREGKKRPFQDDTALIIAAALILIVAQYYYYTLIQELSKPKKVVIKVEGDDIARAVSQNLTEQRHSIETHIKNFMAIPDKQANEAHMARRKPYFSEQGWQDYQQYIATMQSRLSEGQALRAEFTLGSQKYAVLGSDLTGFRAEGLFCLGQEPHFKCGPQGFSLQIMLRGNVNKPDILQFEDWSVMPPRTTRP